MMPNQFTHLSLSERLERSIHYEVNSGCWLWSGAMERHGYGRLFGSDGHIQSAHRASWEIHNGPIADGLCVCHRCDTPACVNPSHLFLGSQRENIQDASRKRRTPLGERQGHSKLKNAEVLEIRRLAASGEKQKDIGRRFGIAQPTVSEIVARRRWPHI